MGAPTRTESKTNGVDVVELMLSQGNIAQAERSTLEAIEFARKSADQDREADYLTVLGRLRGHQNRLHDAEVAFEASLHIYAALKRNEGLATTQCHLADVYQRRGNLGEAAELFLNSLEVFRRGGDELAEAHALNSLAVTYQLSNRFAEAEECLRRSLDIKRRLRDTVGEAKSLTNLGLLFERQSKWNEARRSFEACLALRERVGDRMGTAKTLQNLALLHEAQDKIVESLHFQRQALPIFEQTDDHRSITLARALVAKWEEKLSGAAKVDA